MAYQFLILALSVTATIVFSPASGQITTPCTPSMITTFAPCMSFASNSSFSGTSPPTQCCDSLKSLMSSGKDCLCLIVTGSVPFNIPINRTLALSLPRACNMPGVPLQCKASAAPIPAPAPAPLANGPSLTPAAATPSASGLEPLSPGSAPGGETTPSPPAPATNGESPTSNTGSRAGVTPSAAQPSYSFSPLLFVAVLGAMALKYY